MDARAFWDVIGAYNGQTLAVQVGLCLLLAAALALSYTGRVRWCAKAALGVVHLYIGVVFFGIYGTQPIQTFFALPLYLACGALFLVETGRRREDALAKPTLWQGCLLALYLLYPVISLLLGNPFPRMVTYIMPCPVVSLGIAVYSGYGRRNPALLALLTLWGLTGVKSLLFHAYEDLILLTCGCYGVLLLVRGYQKRGASQ